MNALALIIGNDDYQNKHYKLNNAVNDANGIETKLIELGFSVISSKNCTLVQFDKVLEQFGLELKNFDVGLFYFSGHGMQMEGKNYLTTIDTAFQDKYSLKRSSILLDDVISLMQGVKPSTKILILDACRNDPFPNERGKQPNGLAPVHAPKGTLIAYSTSPGETASDAGVGNNSYYTGSLLNHLSDQNIPIEELFKRVRRSVFEITRGKQTSWEHTSLIGNFFFNTGEIFHLAGLPYKPEYIADENYSPRDTKIGKVIEELRSHDFYIQNAAIKKLSGIDITEMDINDQFVLGRNILQAAEGGAFDVEDFVKRSSSTLLRFSKNEANHILNGLLYEIYFNSKGHFRQTHFKTRFLKEIQNLQTYESFRPSFEFIRTQLDYFKNLFLIYLPTIPPKSLPIEVLLEVEEGDFYETLHKVVSIKHEGVEYLQPEDKKDPYRDTVESFESFEKTIRNLLCIPSELLRITLNHPKSDIQFVRWPLKLKLMRQN